MKWNQKSKGFPALIAALGVVTCLLRFALYATALDEKNLLLSGHWLTTAIWAVTAVAAIVIALGTRGASWQEEELRPSILGAVTTLLFGAAIGAAVYVQGMPVALMEKLSGIVGVLCVPAMVWAAVCRFRGSRPFFVCHGLVCVYLGLYLVANYRGWSGNPQLQDYVFVMLSCASLALFAYQQTAFAVGLGNGKALNLFGLLAAFLGIAAVCHAGHPWLHLAGSLWALTNLSRPVQAIWYRRAREGR